MSIKNIQDLIKLITYDEFMELLQWLPNEEKRRINSVQQELGKVQIIEELRKNGDIKKPTNTKIDNIKKGTDTKDIPEWVNPGTIHSKMYIKGDVVKHNGKVWVSTTSNLNSWEPGAPGVYENVWSEVPTELVNKETPVTPDNPSGNNSSIPEWKPNTTYKKGNKVIYNGVKYELLQNHESKDYWRPGAGTESIYKAIK